MEIKELDLTVDGVEEVLERTNEIFSGILEVIEELETELDILKNEQVELEASGSYTASKLKRKAVIGNEILAIEGGLAKAKEEHQLIAEAHSHEIRDLKTELDMKYNAKLRAITNDLKNKAFDKFNEAETLVEQVNKITQDGRNMSNREVVKQINDATGLQEPKRILSHSYSSWKLTLESLVTQKKQGRF